MKPVVGLSCSFEENRYFLKHQYADAVFAAGAIPVILPYVPEEEIAPTLDRLDGLLLTGGDDVSPACYGEEPHPRTEATTLRRDRFELLALEEAFGRSMPVFGICRGLQILNVYLGGSLFQDIPETFGAHHEDGVFHPVLVEKGSDLYGLSGPQYRSNSFHHQALNRLGRGITPIAYSHEGIVEAISHERENVFGVQWHPERSDDTVSHGLFRRFVTFAEAYRRGNG
ncbi:MAG: hypothetical protein DBY42_05655 [Bacillota bacterium]|nr:MAG: hypothetical protein DBY42_05655 [Bacillota bacterium]